MRPTAAILTKLDEAPHTAGVLSAIVATDRSAGVPLSYTTNGQQVPDDISTADAGAAAVAIASGEGHGSANGSCLNIRKKELMDGVVDNRYKNGAVPR